LATKTVLSARSVEDVAEMISGLELFQALDRPEIEDVIRQSRRSRYDSGSVLIKQGDQGDSMHVVLEGLLEAFVGKDEGSGDEVRVGRIIPGQFFGEMSLLTGEPRSATVRSATPALTYEISKESIAPLLERRPELMRIMSELIAHRQVLTGKARERADREADEDEAKSIAAKIYQSMMAFFRR